MGIDLSNKWRANKKMAITQTLDYPILQNSEVAALNDKAAKTETVDVTTLSDYDLTQASSKGDMVAFEEVYNRHHRRVYAICLRMLKNTNEAEDLTQDVFIQLHRKIGSFRGDSAFTTWLHRLTVNQVLMHFRKRTVKFEKTTEEGDTPVQIVRGSEKPNKMPVVDKIAIQNAIKQLPNGYRNVFILHDMEGFEHEEVARILGCSVGTSKSQLHKARLKLRKLLKRKAPPRLFALS